MYQGRIVREGGPAARHRARGQGLRLDHRRARRGRRLRRRETMSAVGSIEQLAAEFPVLRREFGGQPVCYLDSAATSQTPQPVIDAMTALLHRASRLDPPRRVSAGGRGHRPVRGRPGEDRRLARLDGRGDDLHRQRDDGDQPRRLYVGPAQRRLPAIWWCSPRWSTTPTSSPGRSWPTRSGPRSPTCRSSMTARSTSTPTTGCSLAGPKLVGVVHVSNVLGTINPVAEIGRCGPRRRCGDRRRRLSGRAPDGGRPAVDRRRLLRLDRAQGLRARPGSVCCTAVARCWRRCRRSSAAVT